MAQKAGELIETCGEVRVEWRIDDIQLEDVEGDKEYTSSVFSLSDACWTLRITITTLKTNKIFFSLRREDCGPPKSVICTLDCITSPYKYQHSLCKEKLCVFRKIDENSMKFEYKYTYRASVITCTLKSEDQHPVEVSLFRRLWNASLSLRNILAGRESTDALLKLKGREAPAHKLILESRFPDFARKLDKEMKESPTGMLDVQQGDEDAFGVFLSYVYSSEPEGLNSENVCSVYRISLKYDLQELRKLCTVFLEKDLTVAGVCDVLAMADLYGEELLKERAKEFFAKNASKILETEKWESFKKENTSLFLELLECMMKGNA